MTINQRHSWFYFTKDLYSTLAPEDQELVVAEPLSDEHIRAWYPKSKYQKKFSKGIVGLAERLTDAVAREDYQEIAKIQSILKLMKELKE